MPSSRMTALLALLAVAGYQNRDKLGEIFGSLTGQGPSNAAPGANAGVAGSPMSGGLGGLLGGLFGGSVGGLGGGLSDLINNMSQNGHGEAANTWVQSGPNAQLNPGQLEQALGSDTIDELAAKTGLSREDLLARLQSVLPTAVDKLTPQGRLPTEAESSQWKL